MHLESPELCVQSIRMHLTFKSQQFNIDLMPICENLYPRINTSVLKSMDFGCYF